MKPLITYSIDERNDIVRVECGWECLFEGPYEELVLHWLPSFLRETGFSVTEESYESSAK